MNYKAVLTILVVLFCFTGLNRAVDQKGSLKPPPGFKMYDYKFIENPKPNLFEKEYVELVEIQRLNAELQDEGFIFKPSSIAGDGNGSVFVFDVSQAKIFKLDEQLKILDTYCKIGEGPGDFMGPRHFVALGIGLDGYLYAKDLNRMKVMKFTRHFKYLDQFKYKQNYYFMPVVDEKGNMLVDIFENNTMTLENQNGKVLVRQQVQEKDLGSLYYKKPSTCRPADDRAFVVMPGSVLLFFLKCTGKVFIFKDYKLVKEKYLWPKNALEDLKRKAKKDHEKSTTIYPMLFELHLFIDMDKSGTFYCQYGYNDAKDKNLLYQFSIDGQIGNVYFIRKDKRKVRFLFKQNNKFFAIVGESIIVYKEKGK